MVKYLEIGQIVSTHGIKGEVRVQPWCDSPEYFCKFKKLYNKDGSKTYVMSLSRPHGNMVIAKIKGVETVEDAQALRNRILYMDRADAKLPEGSYFVADLIGLEIYDEQGEFYGKLTDVLKTGANDVYELKDGDKTYYIPAIPSVVLSTDIEGGKMIIWPMEGLFE